MCLILLAYRHLPGFPLVVAANRDEFYARPTSPAAWWDDEPAVLGGRDLAAGGTWMGLTRSGRFAALTNVRDLARLRPEAPTRGALVAGFLTGRQDPRSYLDELVPRGHRYNGFNLLVGSFGGDGEALLHFSNEEGRIRPLRPGIYGISNALLDTPWPKVEAGKAALRRVLEEAGPRLDPEAVFDLLADTTRAPDDVLPDTGVGGMIRSSVRCPPSAACIRTPEYGTRTSTLLYVQEAGDATFIERTHPVGTQEAATRRFDVAFDEHPATSR